NFARMLAKDGALPELIRILEQVGEAGPIEVAGHGQAGDLAQSRINIDQFGKSAGFSSAALEPARADDEGRAGGQFEVGVLAPQAEFAEMNSVVAGEYDRGAVPQALLIEGG